MFLLYFQAIGFLYKGGTHDISGKNQHKVDVKSYIPLKIPSVLLCPYRRFEGSLISPMIDLIYAKIGTFLWDDYRNPPTDFTLLAMRWEPPSL